MVVRKLSSHISLTHSKYSLSLSDLGRALCGNVCIALNSVSIGLTLECPALQLTATHEYLSYLDSRNYKGELRTLEEDSGLAP